MKKRLLAFFLLAVMGCSLAACTSGDPTDTDTGSQATQTDASTDTHTGAASSQTDVSTRTETASETDSQVTDTSATTDSVSASTSTKTEEEEENPDVPVYDETLDHKVILADNTDGSIVVLDLDDCNQVWTDLDWKRSETFSATWIMELGDTSLCGIKYRYSSYYDRYVVLATSSMGKVYAIDYETKETLWFVHDFVASNFEPSLYNAHSIEMLPNGDIVVATSGFAQGGARYENGGILYYPAGSTTWSTFLSLPFAHAVLWDPSEECLWSIGFEGIVAIKVTGEGKQAELTKIPEKTRKMGAFTGHDMVPAFGMDGKFWISDESAVYLYDSATKKLTKNNYYTAPTVKGIAYFEDGTIVTSNWTKNLVLSITTEGSYYRPKKSAIYLSNQIYKIHTMTEKYE